MVLNDGFSIACGTKAVKIIEAQRPGKSAQKSDVFLLGFKLQRDEIRLIFKNLLLFLFSPNRHI